MKFVGRAFLINPSIFPNKKTDRQENTLLFLCFELCVYVYVQWGMELWMGTLAAVINPWRKSQDQLRDSNLYPEINGPLNKPWIHLPSDILLCKKTKLVFLKAILAEYLITCSQKHTNQYNRWFWCRASSELLCWAALMRTLVSPIFVTCAKSSQRMNNQSTVFVLIFLKNVQKTF